MGKLGILQDCTGIHTCNIPVITWLEVPPSNSRLQGTWHIKLKKITFTFEIADTSSFSFICILNMKTKHLFYIIFHLSINCSKGKKMILLWRAAYITTYHHPFRLLFLYLTPLSVSSTFWWHLGHHPCLILFCIFHCLTIFSDVD